MAKSTVVLRKYPRRAFSELITARPNQRKNPIFPIGTVLAIPELLPGVPMHELSIAQSIYDIVCQHVSRTELPRVRSVRVLVGTASGVVADSLAFSFQAIVSETPLADARMEIESIPYRLRCENCRTVSDGEGGFRLCPACGSVATTVLSGTELQVKDIELEDEAEEKR